MKSCFKEILKVIGIILIALLLGIATISSFFIYQKIQLSFAASKIESILKDKEYEYYCVVSSYTYSAHQKHVTVDGYKIDTKNKEGRGIGDDGLFGVIFTNDLKKAEIIIQTTRDSSPYLFDKNDPNNTAHYCKRI
jgi:hypothetical protein